MPPDGGSNLNVVVRDGKIKGEMECCSDRSVSTGGYTAPQLTNLFANISTCAPARTTEILCLTSGCVDVGTHEHDAEPKSPHAHDDGECYPKEISDADREPHPQRPASERRRSRYGTSSSRPPRQDSVWASGFASRDHSDS